MHCILSTGSHIKGMWTITFIFIICSTLLSACTGEAEEIPNRTLLKTHSKAQVEQDVNWIALTIIGPGSVKSQSGEAGCRTQCLVSYKKGTKISLTAMSDASAEFIGWNGDCGGVSDCKLSMNEQRQVTASFSIGRQTPKQHPILPHPSDKYLADLVANKKELAKVKKSADGFDPDHGRKNSPARVRDLLLYYLATREAPYLDKIKAMLVGSYPNMYKYKTKLIEFTLAYDWIYQDLDEASRQAFLKEIIRLCDQWKSSFENMRVSPYNDVGYIRLGWAIFAAAPVVYLDEPKLASPYYQFAEDVLFSKYLPVWRQVMSGGGWHEGAEYVNLGIGRVIVPALNSWGSATGRNLFMENQWLEEFINYPIYTTRPDLTPVRIGDVAWGQTTSYPDLKALSVIYNNPYGRWWSRISGARASSYMPSAWPWGLPDTHTAEVQSIDTLPLSHFFTGWGTVVMRSDWGEDAIYATFRAGDNFWSHQNFDSGAFTIYNRGALAIDSGGYSAGYNTEHHYGYAMQSIAHNVVTVTDPQDEYLNITKDVYVSPGVKKKIVIPNDGGQRRVGSGFMNSPDDIADWLDKKDDYEMGNILAFQAAPHFDYVLADIDAAYNNKSSDKGDYKSRTTRVDDYQRAFVYLRPSVFVVFDRIKSVNASFKKRWLLHAINEPQVEGAVTTITRADNVKQRYTWKKGLVHRSKDRKHYQYGGKLFVHTLLPSPAKIVKVGGHDHQFDVGGVNYAGAQQNADTLQGDPTKGPHEPGSWRIEVSPFDSKKTDLFLHVLYPGDAVIASMPKVLRVDDATGTIVGALIAATKDSTAWFVSFPKRVEELENVIYNIEGHGVIKQLLTGLKPKTKFTVIQNESIIATLLSSEQGTLFFEALLDGDNSFHISRTL